MAGGKRELSTPSNFFKLRSWNAHVGTETDDLVLNTAQTCRSKGAFDDDLAH
jgi:hypothetical protein